MKKEFIHPTPMAHLAQGVNMLAELEKMHKNTLQRLDMLVDLQHLILQELKKQAKEKGSA